MTESSARYTGPAKIFHWVTSAAVITVVILGIAMVNVGSGETQNKLFDLHRSFGALILVLTAGRLLWRLHAPPPPLVPMPEWKRRAAVISHRALYLLLFAVPLMGWTATSAYGAPITVFGLFRLPAIVPENKPLSEALLPLHVTLAFTLVAAVVVHVGAALHHHFIRKDETLKRMLPGS